MSFLPFRRSPVINVSAAMLHSPVIPGHLQKIDFKLLVWPNFSIRAEYVDDLKEISLNGCEAQASTHQVMLIHPAQCHRQQQTAAKRNGEYQRNIKQWLIDMVEMMGAHIVNKQRVKTINRQ